MSDTATAAWIAKQLEQAPPLTQQQHAALRRVLLAPQSKHA